jgi:hypothetical protein
MDDVMNGATPAPHAFVAGFYTFSSTAYFSYCERAAVGSAEILSSTAWAWAYADVWNANPKLNNCWDDQVITFNVADYLPASISGYMNSYLLFDEQMF